MSEYERIRGTLLQQRQLWEDPDFPAIQPSVFYHQVPPFRFEWRRPRCVIKWHHFCFPDITHVIMSHDEQPAPVTRLLPVMPLIHNRLRELHYDKPTFIAENETFDVVSGRLGDKWLLSCIEVLYQCKGLFHKVVPSDQHIDSNYTGIFRFRLFWCGKWTEVLVDDRLPTVNGILAFMHSTHSEQMWPALLEKAYAKMHGSYEALKYGNLLDGLADFTGGIPLSLPLSVNVDHNSLYNFTKMATIITAYCSPNVTDTPMSKNIEPGMNYMIYNVEKIEDLDGRMKYFVHLGRPGKTNRCILDPAMANLLVGSAIRERFMSPTRGFWMSYENLASTFPRVDVVHLDVDTSKSEPSLCDKLTWQVKCHQGRWKKGVSAGGCRNPVNFFHMNPQIQIVLNEPGCVVISLNQHSIMEPKVIGFSIYKIPKLFKETAPPLFFKTTKSTINSQYTNSRQVSERYYLESGAYLVIPTTFEPRQEANFSLRVFSMMSVKMNVLDCAPQMLKSAMLKAPVGTDASSFAQYESQFLHLADEHKTINAFELQELLERCLPNDYIKSCATTETCRQIVLSLEKDGSGRMCLQDFKDLICSLKHWQTVFKDHAPEKVGVLRIERFRDALRDVGFVIPERALALLVFKYMRKDGMVRFGDFVSAVVFLHRAFHTFFRNCSSPSYKVTFTFSEWLNSTLTC